MTHPLTPREKVFVSASCDGERCHCGAPAVRKVGEEISYDDPNPRRHNLTSYVCARHFAEIMGPAGARSVGYTALASGSGDHAELARLAETNKAYGFLVQVKPDDLLTLIAEVAALREQLDWMTRDRNAVIGERDRADTMMQSADARATEAERKLAEAVGLLRDLASWFDGSAYNGAWVIRSGDLGVDDAIFAARTFLSKEAERG